MKIFLFGTLFVENNYPLTESSKNFQGGKIESIVFWTKFGSEHFFGRKNSSLKNALD
jgi:hypothetical protein